MDAIPRRLNVIRALSAVGLPGALRAAAVAPVSLAPALGMIQSVPAFRASVLSQISLVNSLSAQPVLTLSSIMAAASTPTDPWRAEAARFVGALVARPQVVASHQNELRAVIGNQGAKQMKEAATRFQAHAAGHPELFAQLKNLRSGLDLTDAGAVHELGARLNSMCEDSKSRPGVSSGGAVATSGLVVPSWFDTAGLSFALVKKYKGGLMAVLRRGRYELMVDLVKKRTGLATFTKYALNPMGTPKKEEVALLTAVSRKAVARILRKAQASEPVTAMRMPCSMRFSPCWMAHPRRSRGKQVLWTTEAEKNGVEPSV